MSAQPQDVTVITKNEVAQAQQQRVSLIEKMADKYHLDPRNMMATLKATAFRGEVSNEQMAALLIVADAHNLNPWLKEIYAFPSRQGIVPIVGLDGWARIINEHPEFDGMEFEQDEEKCTCRMFRKDRGHPVAVTEYLSECKRPTDPWNTHPKRMLRHKAMIQCARVAFSFAGIYDPDEGERVLAAENAIDVTPLEDRPQETNFGTVKISAVKKREIIEGLLAATKADDMDAFMAVYKPLTNGEKEVLWKELRSYERTAIKKLEDRAKKAGIGVEVTPWALSLIAATKTPEDLLKSWTLIQDAFAAEDQEVPADIETVYVDRKNELGA